MKRYLYIIIPILVFSLIIFLLSYDFSKNNDLNIIIGKNTVFNKKNNIWSVNKSYDLKWKKLPIFNIDELDENNEYYLYKDINGWDIFTEDKNVVNVDTSDIFSYDYINKMNAFNIDEYIEVGNDLLNDENIQTVINENNLSDKAITTLKKISIDLDNDNNTEYIYLLSNRVQGEESSDNNFYSIAFTIFNNNIYYLYKDISTNPLTCDPSIRNVIDTNNDNNYEFVFRCFTYSDVNSVDILFSYDKKQGYNKIISNYYNLT